MFWFGFTLGILIAAVIGTYDGFPKPVDSAINLIKENLDNFINKA
jgi:hypothetical protein